MFVLFTYQVVIPYPIYSSNMAVERSSCHLAIPPDVAAVLASVVAQDVCYPVWTFSKHNSGYSLKLFWKSEVLKHPPNNAHSVSATSHRKK